MSNWVPFGDITRSSGSIEQAVGAVGGIGGAAAGAVGLWGRLTQAIAGFGAWWNRGETETRVTNAQRNRAAIFERGAIVANNVDAANVQAFIQAHPNLAPLAGMGASGAQALQDAVDGGPGLWARYAPSWLGGWDSNRVQAYDDAMSLAQQGGGYSAQGQVVPGGAQGMQQGVQPMPLNGLGGNAQASPNNNAALQAFLNNGGGNVAATPAPSHPGQLTPGSTPGAPPGGSRVITF